jgi:hypothetical protein
MADNITLCLNSLKHELDTFLSGNEWKVFVFLSLDTSLQKYEIVEKKTKEGQIELPVVVIDFGNTRRQIEQLGDEYGRDYINISIYVTGKDPVQLLTLGNLIRRKIDALDFDVLDYTTFKKAVLGVARITDAEFMNISDPNADRIIDRYSGIITATLEIDSQALT